MYDYNIERINLLEEAPTTEPERQLYYVAKCQQHIQAQKEQLGRDVSCYVETFGCQMNARDSEKLLGILQEIGYKVVDCENADIVLYNTCTVRENANLRVYGRLGQLQVLKKKNPHMIIGLCGCMMQESQVVEKIKKSYKFVNIIFGTFNIFKIAELLCTYFNTKKQVIEIWNDTKKVVEELPTARKYPFKSGVNIMYGCNNFCSYCIVPYVRGREKSRPPIEIIREIERLVKDGVKEVMLLGQNVNSYGKTFEKPFTFAMLLREVEKIEGLERIRFMTPHPKDFSDDLLEVMEHSNKICNHIHFPLQSGSSKILKMMNRKYTKEQYLDWIKKIREKLPDVSLTTDIIVGFPGETEADFEDTLDVIKKAKFDSAYTFIYSKRTGTPAASMEGQVSESVVKDRFNRLLETVSAVSHEIHARYTGQTVKVLVECVNSQDSSLVTGRLTNNMLVHFPGDASLIGTIIDVKLTESKGFYYIGSMEGKNE